jgi:hypothetical protein
MVKIVPERNPPRRSISMSTSRTSSRPKARACRVSRSPSASGKRLPQERHEAATAMLAAYTRHPDYLKYLHTGATRFDIDGASRLGV